VHGVGPGQDRTRVACGGSQGQNRTRGAHGGGQGQDRTRAARSGGRGQDRTRAARGGGRGQDRTRAARGGGRGQDRTRALTRCFYSRTGTNKLLREEGKKERSGRWLLLRISVARSASLHIPSSRSASLHIPSSRIPDGAKGRGLVAGRCPDSCPPLCPSSHEGSLYRCRPLWVASVVNVHCFHLDKIFLGFPCWVRKPPPLYQILQPSSRPSTVQNLFYLPLFFALNDYW